VGPADISVNPDATPAWALPPAVLRWAGPCLLSSGAQQTRLVRRS
jgi:hypothetical protein